MRVASGVLLGLTAADRLAEMLAYLSSSAGVSTLLLSLVGGYSLARYWGEPKLGERRHRELLRGGALTTLSITMLLMLADPSWDIVGIFVGILAGLFGFVKLLWDGYGVIRGTGEQEKRDFVIDGVLLLTGLTHGWLLLAALARHAP